VLVSDRALFVALQQALRQRGYDPGPIDGVRGPKTSAAIRAFQRAHRLSIDGIAGPMTLSRLGLKSDAAIEMGWLSEAWAQNGVAELMGADSNPSLIGYQDDRQPWCGLFVAHCIAHALPAEPLPARPLAARSWLQFGQRCDVQLGAVLIFWRGTPKGWTGHVGFCIGADATAYHVLGGNQGDTVSTVRIARQRLLGARWPMSVNLPIDPDELGSAGTPVLSENEA
jgi:uncharacterized protein (TIGR02594 family)